MVAIFPRATTNAEKVARTSSTPVRGAVRPILHLCNRSAEGVSEEHGACSETELACKRVEDSAHARLAIEPIGAMVPGESDRLCGNRTSLVADESDT